MQFKQTKWQRLVMIGMYVVACRAEHPTQVWFPRRAIEHLTWSAWQGGHTQKMQQLIDHGWIEQGNAENGLLLYRITPAAHGYLAVDIGNAIANVHYDPPTDDKFADFTFSG